MHQCFQLWVSLLEFKKLFGESTTSVTLVKVGAHHLTLGVVFIICGMIGLTSQRQIWILNIRPHMHSFGQSGQPGINQLGGQLCIALAICGYFSVTAAPTS